MTDDEMFNKNMDLETAFMQYILDHPELLDELPKDFQLLVLPDDDPELARKNEALLKAQNFGKPVVVVRMKSPEPAKLRVFPPRVQVLAPA